MTREQHLLTILAEECVEVAQRVTKILRFGLHEMEPEQDKTNAQRLTDEIHDLLGALHILIDEHVVTEVTDLSVLQAIEYKKERIEKYLRYSESQGQLDRPKDGDFFIDGANRFRP